MKRCNKFCSVCPYVSEVKVIKGDTFLWKIRKHVTCESKNVIYMIECNLDRCRKRYIGERENVKNHFLQHLGYVKNNILTQATGSHFNLPGHDISNMTLT